MKEIKLNSGALLKIGEIPFAEAKALYQAILKEMKGVKFDSKTDFASVIKDLFCAGFSSEEVENCLWKCMARCLYNGLKIEPSTFEPIAAREDYLKVSVDVVEECVRPFVKGLSAELLRLSTLFTSART